MWCCSNPCRRSSQQTLVKKTESQSSDDTFFLVINDASIADTHRTYYLKYISNHINFQPT